MRTPARERLGKRDYDRDTDQPPATSSSLAAGLERVGEVAAVLLVVGRLERKQHIVGRERLAVGKDDAVAQGERVADGRRPIGVQRSASHGSTSSVTLLTRTSFACVSSVRRVVAVSRDVMRLNVRGSVREEIVSVPPGFGASFDAPPVAGPAPWGDRQAPARTATRAIQASAEGKRRKRVFKNRPGGQKTGRSKCRASCTEIYMFAYETGHRHRTHAWGG